MHFTQQAFAEGRRHSAEHAVGPALTDCLKQERLGPGGLEGEVGELENTLCGGD